MAARELAQSIRDSGISAINFTISERDYEGTIEKLAYIDQLVDTFSDLFLVVRRHSDIARAKQSNRIGLMPGFQYTSFFEDKPDRVDTFCKLGVRIMQLTYNNRSAFGDGCLEPGNAGLSRAGIALIKK